MSICVIFLGIEKALKKIGDNYGYQYKHDYLISHLDKIKVIALGHSHIADGINMIALNDSGFNLAIPSRNMFYDAEIVKEFVPKMPKLKTVIIPLGYNFQYIDQIPDQQKCMMAKYWGYIPSGASPLVKLEILYGSKKKIADLLLPSNSVQNNYDSLGHQRLPQQINNKQVIADLPKTKSKNGDNTQFVKAIKEIARICKDNGVRLIAITMPCYHTFTDCTNSQGIAELHALADTMRKVYPEMEYYDFMRDARFDASDFFNASHLNEVGALKFTSILKTEILPSRD